MSHFECAFYKVTRRGTTPQRVSLDAITAEERAGKELLGKADGRDLGHCIYLGIRHCERFAQRAHWYHISSETDAHLEELRQKQPGSIRVEFYGEKK